VLKRYQPADVPSEHIPTRRDAALAKFAEQLDAASLNA
jgi:acyl-CoA dehydrogenase